MVKGYGAEFLTFWHKLTKAEKLTWGITGVGLAVDLYAIAQIIGHVQSVSDTDSNDLAVSPWIAFAIWLLALFAYITVLHTYWQRNRIEAGFSLSFGRFLVVELFAEFRIPTFLFPFLILLVILFFISGLDDSGISLFILGFVVLIGITSLAVYRFEAEDVIGTVEQVEAQQKVSQESKIWIESNWDFLTERIQTELARKQFVIPSDFRILQATRELSTVDIRYALARYAEQHPREVQFGSIWYRRQSEPENYEHLADDALVNLSTLDYSRFALS